jgi:hypothetical protein
LSCATAANSYSSKGRNRKTCSGQIAASTTTTTTSTKSCSTAATASNHQILNVKRAKQRGKRAARLKRVDHKTARLGDRAA